MLVEFDALTSNPKETMASIWQFLGMESPEHDFDNVKQVTTEDDSVLGLDLHTIRPKVESVADDAETILGASLCQKLEGAEFWRPTPTPTTNNQ